MGNRGLLHDGNRQIVRLYRLKAWITCVLEFKGRRRQVMTPNRYTELFFLDEATSFSAGHRPCAECRRQDFVRWKGLWLAGNPEHRFPSNIPIREIDAILHEERMRPRMTTPVRDLPDGCFVTHEDQPFLLAGGLLHPWSPFGYGASIRPPEEGEWEVLTPASVVRTFRAGYVPQMAVRA